MSKINPVDQGLYCHADEHDACGVGLVVNITGYDDQTALEDKLYLARKAIERLCKDAETAIDAGYNYMIISDRNVGKGLYGGKIIVRPILDSSFAAEENIIAGSQIAKRLLADWDTAVQQFVKISGC